MGYKSARKLKAGDELLSQAGTSLGIVKKIRTTTDQYGTHRTKITMTSGRVIDVNGGYATTDDVRIR